MKLFQVFYCIYLQNYHEVKREKQRIRNKNNLQKYIYAYA